MVFLSLERVEVRQQQYKSSKPSKPKSGFRNRKLTGH